MNTQKESLNLSNVDPIEREKFARLAADWWNKTGPMKPLHQLNPLRLDYIQQHAHMREQASMRGKAHIRGKTKFAGIPVLDVGCGGGILAESLARNGALVTAIDINPDLIQVAKQHAELEKLNIHYQAMNIEDLLKQDLRFAVITCMELLEHVPDPKLLIAQCAQLLIPGGKIFFSTINRNLKAFCGAIIAAEYLLGMLPRGTHQYEKFIRPAELTDWANQANLHLMDLQGVNYRALTREFELGRDVSINYMAIFELR